MEQSSYSCRFATSSSYIPISLFCPFTISGSCRRQFISTVIFMLFSFSQKSLLKPTTSPSSQRAFIVLMLSFFFSGFLKCPTEHTDVHLVSFSEWFSGCTRATTHGGNSWSLDEQHQRLHVSWPLPQPVWNLLELFSYSCIGLLFWFSNEVN